VQAWRWNLDHVVDVHGNTVSYSYVKEGNRYGRNMTGGDAAAYDRGGYLSTIEYGTRTGGTGPAPMQVGFEVAERCVGACVKSDPATYPDTPVDLECNGAPCNDFTPSFWSTKRLASITTRVWDPDKLPAAGYKDVRKWTFTHTFPDPGDSTRAGLWLSRIGQTGLVGETTTLPDIVLSGTQLHNRVDTIGDQLFPMNWWRVSRIDTETGGAIKVAYEPQECVAGSVMPDVNALQNNTLRCFPVKWTPDGAQSPITDFFHKYVVAEVREGDLVGKAPDVIHRYQYVGGGAWHYTDDDGLTKPDSRTWSAWRGYATVQIRKGDPAKVAQTLSESLFFRGMHGDHLPSGTRTVSLPAVDVNRDGDTTDAGVDAPAVADEDAYSGMVRTTVTYNGTTGPETAATINEPWQSAPTASRTINGETVHARFAALATNHGRVALDTDGGARAAGWRTASSHTVFDEHGLPIEVDKRGDDTVTDDQDCTLTEYARNTNPANGVWLTEFVKRTRTFGVDCQTAKTAQLSEDDIIGEARSLYDGAGYGVAPTRGLVTEVQQLKSYTGGTPAFVTVARSQHDAYGRVIDSWDVDNRHTGIAYTPADRPMTKLETTNSQGWTITTKLEPAWGVPTAVTDYNGKLTEAVRDGLGRTRKLWLPGRSREAQHTPHITYTYTVRTDGANAVVTDRINAAGTGYITTTELFDGLLRPRQAQAPDAAVAGARVVTDTLYDSAGRAFLTTNPYTMTGVPSRDLYEPKPPQYSGPEALPGWTLNLYDGAGRVTDAILYSRNVEKWRAHTAYTGDRTDVTPPQGGTATSTLTDAMGRTVALRQYHGPTPTGPRDTTIYEYDRKDQLERVTDPMGNHWDYRYDLRGRQIEVNDPDAGKTSTTYDDAGRIVTQTDGRNITIAYTYDALGRKSTVREGSITGDKRAEWFYDTVLKGQLSKSTRYVKRDAVFDSYSTEILSYSEGYQPGIVRYVLPASETGFGTTIFSYTNTYNTDRSLSSLRIPGAGGLPLETTNLGYNSLSLPTTLSSNGTLVTATGYTNYGEPNILTLQNNSGRIAQIGYYYKDDGTHRLNEIKTTSAAAPTTTYSDLFYEYDPAGNIQKIADTVSGDNQCFDYDQLLRLTQAWTPGNGDCNAAPSVPGLGGPAKYWQQWTFDQAGNRRTQTDHVNNTNATYTYPAAGTPRPHALSQVDYTGSVTRTDTYTYDDAGNTRTRPASSGNQTLFWDAENHLEKVSDASGNTTFIYDAEGNRLLRKDPAGKTLYLPGQEVRYTNSSGSLSCTRYYTHLGKTIAMRTSAGLTWLSGNDQNTSTLAITASSQATAQRWMDPYGNQRGSAGTWPASMDKGLVGGTQDNTGLTHLGAREYDPTLGRFVSVDPVMDLTDPQQWSAYAYANNTPVTASDPGGRCSNWVDGEFCGDSPPPAPSNPVISYSWATPKITTRVYADGTVSINGYVLPEGAVDLDLLEQRMREIAGKVGFEDTPEGIIRIVAQACSTGTDVCDVSVTRAVMHDLNGRILLDILRKEGKDLAGSVDYEMWIDIAVFARNGMSPLGDNVPGVTSGNTSPSTGLLNRFGKGFGKTRSGCSLFGNSFDPGTEVLMADGTTKKIKDIRSGDKVLATDPQTGQTAGKAVTALIEGQGHKDLVRVTVHTGRGDDVILATAEHPFWVDNKQRWVDAGDLRPGMKLRTSDGHIVAVEAVSGYQSWKTVNNLSIADIHTFYVLAGDTPVLVHNAPACRTLGHYPDYVDLARTTGARNFSVPDDVWNRMTPAEQWAANQKFLDRGIANGDTFLLATPIDDMRTVSWYADELNYLMSKGYTFNAAGTAMIPGPKP
jgi:RHS repeat-associated protein